MLRTEAGHSPHDKGLSNLIGELSTRSENFRTWWAAHNVRFHRTGVKRFHHPVVGDLTLTFEALDLAADSGLRISAYTAEPGTPSDDALKVLASWAATLDQAAPRPRTATEHICARRRSADRQLAAQAECLCIASGPPGEGGPASTPNDRPSPRRPAGGCLESSQ